MPTWKVLIPLKWYFGSLDKGLSERRNDQQESGENQQESRKNQKESDWKIADYEDKISQRASDKNDEKKALYYVIDSTADNWSDLDENVKEWYNFSQLSKLCYYLLHMTHNEFIYLSVLYKIQVKSIHQ